MCFLCEKLLVKADSLQSIQSSFRITNRSGIHKQPLQLSDCRVKPLCKTLTLSFQQVLRTLIDLLPSEPAVQQVTLDFEKALWLAFRSILPAVKIQGCVFHWTQAVWRKVSKRKQMKQITNARGLTTSRLFTQFKMTYQTDAYYYMNLLACYVWAVRVTI